MTEVITEFLAAADAWVQEGYALDVRYIADVQSGRPLIWSASIGLHPVKARHDVAFALTAENIVAGQVQRFPVAKRELLALLTEASQGTMTLPELPLTLPDTSAMHFSSGINQRELWFFELSLQVGSSQSPSPSPVRLALTDSALRSSSPPFDGLSDLSLWLGLPIPALTGVQPSISLRVSPPVDLILDRCSLKEERLKLVLNAHPHFDLRTCQVAIRAVPHPSLEARRQVAEAVKWGDVSDGRREGIATLPLPGIDQVLVMLLIGSSTVRRHWFVDSARARNNRLLAMQHFDAELRMTRSAVLESSDSNKFEQGVAGLLYLLGFSPALQLETNAPDIVVSTPMGRIALVECTIRIADFQAKIGRLVDRRGSLSKALASAGHPAQLLGVLVCRLPRDQIAAQAELLRAHGIALIAGEELVNAFEYLRFASDPDQLYDRAQSQLRLQS